MLGSPSLSTLNCWPHSLSTCCLVPQPPLLSASDPAVSASQLATRPTLHQWNQLLCFSLENIKWYGLLSFSPHVKEHFKAPLAPGRKTPLFSPITGLSTCALAFPLPAPLTALVGGRSSALPTALQGTCCLGPSSPTNQLLQPYGGFRLSQTSLWQRLVLTLSEEVGGAPGPVLCGWLILSCLISWLLSYSLFLSLCLWKKLAPQSSVLS